MEQLHIETFGPDDGRDVVLIHGWPMSGKSWEHQIPALTEAGFRVTTYDRRGFGDSTSSSVAYTYDSLADDLAHVLASVKTKNATLVGFSMGGGEVARYISRHGDTNIKSVVFAAAVPPFLLRTTDNPEGPLTQDKADEMEQALRAGSESFFEEFTRDFFSVNGELKVSEEELNKAKALCHQSDEKAALGCMKAFASTDFRSDLTRIRIPTLIIHSDADAIVPLEGSGLRTFKTIPQSKLHVIESAPHGLNVSHSEEFNRVLIKFLKE